MATLYATGLRCDELRHLRVADIDSPRMLIRVREGKGRIPRDIGLSPVLLERLRVYWRWLKPNDWLFPSKQYPSRPLDTRTIRLACHDAAQRAGITKHVSPHVFRHYAGFRTIPGEARVDGRKARQCCGGARPLVELPGIVLVIGFEEKRAARHRAGSGRACPRAAWSWPESPPSLRGWLRGRSAWSRPIHGPAKER